MGKGTGNSGGGRGARVGGRRLGAAARFTNQRLPAGTVRRAGRTLRARVGGNRRRT